MSRRTAGSNTPADNWRSECLFDQGDDFFDALLLALENAHTSIDLEVYIFELDLLGLRILDALINAHQRGVKVRLLIDGIGSYNSSQAIFAKLSRHSIEVRVYHPLPWQVNHYSRSIRQGRMIDKALHFLKHMNRRDHRKLCIIDNRQLWTGSLNISRVHLSRKSGGHGWRDYGVCLEGEQVDELSDSFDAIWYARPANQKSRLRLYWDNLNGWTRRRKNRKLVNSIAQASTRVWITSAYFAPSRSVLRALKRARAHDVDIRIIVPAQSDIPIFPFLTATYYKDLIKIGVSIFEYQPAVLHAKVLLIDDQVIIGSTNFNHRSFLHDLELDIILSQPTSKQRMEQWYLDDLSNSEQINSTLTRWAPINWVLGWFSKTLRYWM